MWYCKKSPKINLSIGIFKYINFIFLGYDTIATLEFKINYSNVQGRI